MMGRRADGTRLGYTALVHPIGSPENVWSEAYGYLGSYYKTYHQALFEIDFLMSHYPEKYDRWMIEQIVLKDGTRVDDHPDEMIYAEGRNDTPPGASVTGG